MSKYLSIEDLNRCFQKQENKLRQLHELLHSYSLLTAHVFVLPDVKKGNEHDPITEITVDEISGNEALNLGLSHYQRLFIHHNNQNISSKAAVRLPGVLCFSVNQQQYYSALNLIEEINKLKAELEHIVTVQSGVNKEQRFEFVHNQLHGLITLNAYRTITPLLNPDSVRFGWANKNIINKVTKNQILARLEKSYHSGVLFPPIPGNNGQNLLPKKLLI